MRRPATEILPIAEELVDKLSPYCDRIEIAGSLRRQTETVKDIEIVCVPRMQYDLFGAEQKSLPSHVTVTLDEWLAEGRIRKRVKTNGHLLAWGPKFKAFWLVLDGGREGCREPVAVDLFAVLPPAQWGAIFAIRTGSGEYSKMLVTECQKRSVRCVEGALRNAHGSIIETPEEEDFFRECGVPWIRPQDR